MPPQLHRRRSQLSLERVAPTYRWSAWGDLNPFFGLMLDNLTNLVILTGILVGGFQFPAEIVFTHMVPATALGVLVGDLIYAWLAFRLAAREGRDEVTAMPLGLDTPTTIGLAVGHPLALAPGDRRGLRAGGAGARRRGVARA